MTNDVQNGKDEIYKLKKLIIILLDLLEANIKSENTIENQEFLSLVIGKKESIISAVCKLGNLLLKINLDESKASDSTDYNNNIEEIDIELLRDYLSSIKNSIDN